METQAIVTLGVEGMGAEDSLQTYWQDLGESKQVMVYTEVRKEN